ncbi:MAG: glycosyltransferase family 2 protein [bacterium]
MELISIITPLYNNEKYIKDTINSVLNQTYENWEMIIVDDKSNDNGFDIASAINDDRIILLSNETNLGVSKTRNKAIDIARGRYIAFLDSDDIWESNYLESQLNFMKFNECVACTSSVDRVTADNQQIIKTTIVPNEITFKQTLKTNNIICSTTVYDTNILGKIYMPEYKCIREDMAAWLIILKNYNFKGNPEILGRYRVHASSSSSSKFKMIKYQYRTYRLCVKKNPFVSAFYVTCWAVSGLIKSK